MGSIFKILPYMNTIQINDRSIHVPSSWNDLSLQQQITCYAIIMTDTGKLLAPFEILPAKKIALLQYLLQLPPFFFQKRERGFLRQAYGADAQTIALSEINDLFAVIDFLFEKQETAEDQPEQYAIQLGLTKCPYPHIEFTTRSGKNRTRRKTRWYAPADGLHNMTLYELSHTFTRLENYLRTQDETHLLELLAIIYRPTKPKTKENIASNYKGDIRLPYREHETTVETRKKRIENLPKSVKQLLVFWFTSCRQAIIRRYPNIFTTPKGDTTMGNNYGYAALLLNLAGGIIHLDTVSDQNFHNAFTHLSYLEDQRKLAALRNT